MTKYLIRRFLVMIVVLWVVSRDYLRLDARRAGRSL